MLVSLLSPSRRRLGLSDSEQAGASYPRPLRSLLTIQQDCEKGWHALQGTVSSGSNVTLNNCSNNPDAPAFTEWPPEKEFGETIKGKLGDTLGDIALIARRTLKKLPNKNRISAQVCCLYTCKMVAGFIFTR